MSLRTATRTLDLTTPEDYTVKYQDYGTATDEHTLEITGTAAYHTGHRSHTSFC